MGLILLVLSPVLGIIVESFNLDTNLVTHIYNTKLKNYISNTLLLITLVICFSFVFAVPTAFLLVRYDFFMSKFFSKAFVFSLAIPTYIMGFAYVMFFEYRGLLSKIMTFFNFHNNFYLDILNIYFASFIIALSLFPYLYVLVKASFSYSLTNLLESSKSLNIKEGNLFFKLILPIGKPAIIMGLFLIAMETLSEYGVVDYFGVDAFSVGIFRAWNGFGDISTSIFLAVFLLLFVIIILGVEKLSRNHKLYQFNLNVKRITIIKKLTFYKKILAFLWCSILFFIAFFLPFIILLFNFIDNFSLLDKAILYSAMNTIFIASISSLVIVFIALLIVYITKIVKGKFANLILFLSGFGYALPGSLVAVGVLVFFYNMNALLGNISDDWQFIFKGGIFALIFSYLVRFIALAINSIEIVYSKNQNLHEVTNSLGANKFTNLFKIDIFILNKALVLSFYLIFIDIIKELPATMILRPFNFDTLAVKTFYLANNDHIAEAAVPSFILILLAIFIIFILNKK